MRHESIVNLWESIEKFMGKEHNMQSIKTKNPFPVSSRTISNIKKTRYEKDGKGFQKAKLIKICIALKIPYIVINKNLAIGNDEIEKLSNEFSAKLCKK